jgi:hypothetical protein
MHITALQLGKDPILLETRAAVLQLSGSRIVNASQPNSWFGEIRRGRYDALIICHSLSLFERSTVIEHACRFHPATPVILVSSSEGCPPEFATVVPTEPGPLLSQFRSFLREMSMFHPLPGLQPGQAILCLHPET